MKSLLVVLLFASTSYAANWQWTKGDIAREVVSAGITVIDWGQTQDIRNHNGIVELNAILGNKPSRAAVNTYFASVMVLHPLISAALPSEAELLGMEVHPRAAWQYIYFGVEAAAISSNFRGGLRMSF